MKQSSPVHRLDSVELEIDRLSLLGEGVAVVDGRSVFIPGAFPGETVRARVEEGKVLRGELLEVLTPSAQRLREPCPLSGRCGGCDWMGLSVEAQREAKQEALLSTLEHLGGIRREAIHVLPIAAGERTLGYRRRAVLHVSRGTLAFFGRRSHERIPIDRCPALVEGLDVAPGALVEALGSALGGVREVHLLEAGGKRAAAFFASGPVKEALRDKVERSLKRLGLSGAVLVPEQGSPVLLGQPVLAGEAPLAPEKRLFFRPDGFAQANAEAALALVETAIEQLAPEARDHALELYAGNGLFSLALASRCAEVLAVEGAKVSVELGQRAAREGGLAGLRFVQGDVGRVCEGLTKEGRKFDLLLADPPRTGAPEIARWAKAMGVRRVVYVACDAAALARDAKSLVAAGFRPEAVRLVDQFPQTHHIEAVCSFTLSVGPKAEVEGSESTGSPDRSRMDPRPSGHSGHSEGSTPSSGLRSP